jgi:hypothetical protein
LHSDHHSVIKEIARHHRRCSNFSGNRTSLGDISNGSYSNYKNDNQYSNSQAKNGVAFNNDQELVSDMGMNTTNNIPSAQFAYIITRPTTFLKDGRSIKKVSASKSVSGRLAKLCSDYLILTCFIFPYCEQQPGPFPIAHMDLAEFTLNTLRNQKLYNSCPYVVTDSF